MNTSDSVLLFWLKGNEMNIGDKVRVTRNADSWLMRAVWWPVGDITGAVTKICKNGSIYVAQDQFRNNSADGLRTRVFSKKDKVTITVLITR